MVVVVVVEEKRNVRSKYAPIILMASENLKIFGSAVKSFFR